MKNKKAKFSFSLAMFITILAGTIGIETSVSLLAAVLVYECGHIAAIYLSGMKVIGIQPELSGLKIIYSETGSRKSELFSAVAGPLAGTVYWVAVRNVGGMWALSGQLSLVYTMFNLLPVKELDGGRILELLAGDMLGEIDGKHLAELCSALICAAVLFGGTVLFVKGEGGGMFAAGIWLFILHKGN